MTDMHRAWKCRAEMAKCQTDPVWYRQQVGLPPKPSRTFAVCMMVLGTAAFYGVLFACASI